MSKMGSYDPFEYLQHKFWPKQKLGIKVSIWLLAIKSQELFWFLCAQMACHISCKVVGEGYKFTSNLTSIGGLHKNYGPLKWRKSQFQEFHDQQFGSPKKNDIWV